MTPQWTEIVERVPWCRPLHWGHFVGLSDVDRDHARAALCRDAALRGLAERGYVLWPTQGGWVCGELVISERPTVVRLVGQPYDTADEAIRAAVATVEAKG